MSPAKDVLASPAISEKFDLEIKDGEIHLWCSRLDPPADWLEVFESSLSDKERRTASFFQFEKDQIAYTASQGFIRYVLSLYLKVGSDEIKFAKHRKGKPYLIDDTSLLYNISNSGNYVLAAISRHGEIGIDLERIRPLTDFDDLIHKNFSPGERAYITKVPSEKLNRFFKLWTLKEAFLKAIGEGMRLTPDNLEFLIDNGNYKLNSGPGFYEFDQWSFSDIRIGTEYLGSLAHHRNPSFISEIRYLIQ